MTNLNDESSATADWEELDLSNTNDIRSKFDDDTFEVFSGLAIANRTSIAEVVRDVCKEYAARRRHESMVLGRILKCEGNNRTAGGTS